MNKSNYIITGFSAIGLVVFLCIGPIATACAATTYTLNDLNTTVDIHPSSQAGVSRWDVNGVNHLSQQWYWYRVGSTGGESSLNTLPHVVNGFMPFGPFNGLNVTYSGSGFSVDLTISTTGGTSSAVGTQVSSLHKTIRIINTGPSLLDMHFFQYVNSDLFGTPNNDTVELLHSNTVEQIDGSLLMTTSESIVSPQPNGFELGTGLATRNSLNNSSPTNYGSSTTLAMGDVTWSFQWNMAIPPGDTALISKVETIRTMTIPFPVAVWPGVITLALLGVVRWHRQRSRSVL